MLATLATIAFLLAVLRLTRRARARGSLLPVDNAQSLYRWGQRFDAEFPAESEARLALQARGAVAKRRMMVHLRAGAGMKALEEATRQVYRGKPLLVALHRFGDGPLTTVRLEVRPLNIARAQPEVPITVRRPRLSLAR